MNGSLLRKTLFSLSEQGNADPSDSVLAGGTGHRAPNPGAYMHSTSKSSSPRFSKRQERPLLNQQVGTSEAAYSDRAQRARQSQRSRLAFGSLTLPPNTDDVPGEGRSTEQTEFNTMNARIPHALGTVLSSGNQSANTQESPAESSSLRLFSRVKPSKSLRQRLELDESHEPASYHASMAVGDGPGIRYTTPHHDELIPRAHSRSVSIVSSAFGRQDDDISSIMMRGATDLRNAKFEIEDQRREIAFLQVQVDAAKKEKEELAQRFNAVKEAAKQSLQSSSKSLDALRATIDELKSQSETSFSMTDSVRASLPDVQELRGTTSAMMKALEPYMEPNEKWVKSVEMKDIINTLELECSKSQQVADLLRDRLQTVGGELIETKSRVNELETAHGEDRTALSKAHATIVSTTEEISSLVARLKAQQIELQDALYAAAEFEVKLIAANERNVELQGSITQKDAEFDTLKAVQRDNMKLRDIIEEKEVSISSLRGLETEIAQVKAIVFAREATISELTLLNTTKDSQISDYNNRIAHLEGKIAEAQKAVGQLRNDLGASDAREKAGVKDNDRLLHEQRAIQAKVEELETALELARTEGGSRAEKLQHADSRFQALEERFEEQSLTLRITRESVGDAQERLLATETSYAKSLSEATARLEREVSVLQEQKQGLQAAMNIMDASLKRAEASALAVQEEHANRLKQQELTSSARLESEEKRLKQVAEDLAEARARFTSAEQRNKALDDEIRELRNQLHKAQLPSPETEAEIRALRSRITTLEGAEMNATLRAKTIDSRYRVGDLSDEEKAFINTLVRTSQSVHEQELVTNRNELRRRDNALKDMRSKVHLLESTLAKHIKAQKAKPTPAPQIVENESMIDPTTWTPSGQSSSPTHAPDRDGLSTNVDVTIPTNKATPAPNRTVPAHVSAGQAPVSKDPPLAISKDVSSPISNKQPKKPNFSRLATDCSDEILDFDDDMSVRKLTPPSLGKRDKPASSPTPMEGQGIPKPLKRLRASVYPDHAANSGVIPKKSLQPSGSRNKGRKRR